MTISKFISVGENIHCTRSYKVDGKFINKGEDGNYALMYMVGDEARYLPIPDAILENNDFTSGKAKHCGIASWQGLYGDEANKALSIDYLQNLARRQEASGATYLDVNVDEFSTDDDERIKLIKWIIETIESATSLPISVDSSNIEILRAGLEACDKSKGKPMVNSVSLERLSALEVIKDFDCVVIASAAGESDLPSTVEGRMENVEKIIPMLKEAGLELCDIHIDPLVFPIATDGNNGKSFIETCSAIRTKYGEDIHIVAGLSNISFGMPNRKLITQVFTHMCVDAGADGGIVDPFQVNTEILNAFDTSSESYQLAKALLTGEDEYGMNYITASREGTI